MDQTDSVGFLQALTSLPHKRLPDDQAWKKAGHRVSLIVEPGHMLSGGEPKLYGVPYGARARMVLLYLQTQAVRTGSREVELGRSMRAWLERMGVSVGGERGAWIRYAGALTLPASGIRRRGRSLGVQSPACG